jgi:MFS family permease
MPATSALPTKRLLVLCLASLCWGFSFGLGAPFASLWLKDSGCSATVIGLNTGIYYFGIALAAGLVPQIMRRSARVCLAAGMLASGLTVAVFPWGGGLSGWFVVRLLNGVAGAMSLIPIETFVNRHSGPRQRARNFGYYAFSMAVGIALGNLSGGQLYPIAPHLAFLLGGLAVLPGTLGLIGWLEWPGAVPEQHHGHRPLALGRHFLSFGSAWSQGFLEGAMVSLLPVYLLAIGLSEAGVGGLLSGIMMGVIVLQVPVAWLADRFGRTAVLLGCYAATAGVLSALYSGISLPWLAICLFLAGGCSSAFYPLGLAILGERVPASRLARANAWYLGINCLGSLIGPVVAGAAMDQLGKQAMFLTGEAAVLLVLVSWLALRLRQSLGQNGVGPRITDVERVKARDAA